MRAHLLALLEDGDGDAFQLLLRIGLVVQANELRELVRGREPRRPGADDDHVDVQCLALDPGKFSHE